MAAEERTGPADLTALEALADDPYGYHFFQALRLIEAAYPDKPRLGESARPDQDPIRIHQAVEMKFSSSTISELKMPYDETPGRLTNRFFGMFGPNGPMPGHFTEHVRERLRNHRDPTLSDFINMFTHRLACLLYRAWASSEPALSFDREDEDGFAEKIDAIAGYKGSAMGDSDLMPDLTKRFFAAHLATGTRSREALEAMLSVFFGADVEVEDFAGSWLELDPGDRWELGSPVALGKTTSIGDRVWVRSNKFRIKMGPLSREDYERLLPGGKSLERLTAIVRNFSGDVYEWDLNLILREDEVTEAELGGSVKLGMMGWSGDRGDAGDAADLMISPDTAMKMHERFEEGADA